MSSSVASATWGEGVGMLGSVVGRDGLITHRPKIGGVTLGYTPESRSVPELLFWTLWHGDAYGAVAVTQGGAQCSRSVRLRCCQLE